MKRSPNVKHWLYACMLMFAGNASIYAQCGTPPSSGSVTISTNIKVNSYYEGAASVSAGSTSLTVSALDARGSDTVIKANDLILIIQMQGADINATNTDSYGDGTSGGNASGYLSTSLVAGSYEYATVSSVSGSTINLANPLVRSYFMRTFTSANAIQSFQVIRVPRYYTLNLIAAGVITAPAWDGKTGGVVVIEAANTLTFTAGSINVAGLGFRGGGGKNLLGADLGTVLTNTDYRWNSPVTTAANKTGGAKGEGIAGTPLYTYVNGTTTTTTGTLEGYIDGSMGRGAAANAGGGGTDGSPVALSSGSTQENQYNSGGGGGGNAGTGGRGGSGWNSGTGNLNTYPYGGYGGSTFTNNSLARLIMGGGGGAGTANNSDNFNEANCSGGVGGGIIICRAKQYSGTGSLIADGADAPGVPGTLHAGSANQTDAAGGGGAGGTIIVVTNQAGSPGTGLITASAKGGKGGDMTTYYDHGPGGGGGGGIIYTNLSLTSSTLTGGINGLTRSTSTTGPVDNAYGATSGDNGSLVTLAGPPVFSNGAGSSVACGVLPVVLNSFTAVLHNESVDLQWQTGVENSFSHFDIEYGADRNQFAKIGTVNNAGSGDYEFVHPSPQPGRNFYRLKMADLDGKYTYSNIIQVNLNSVSNNQTLSVYPNPAFGYATMQLKTDQAQTASLQIIDYAGKVLISQPCRMEKGMNYLPLPGIKALSRGIYLVRIKTTSKIFSGKLVVGGL